MTGARRSRRRARREAAKRRTLVGSSFRPSDPPGDSESQPSKPKEPQCTWQKRLFAVVGSVGAAGVLGLVLNFADAFDRVRAVFVGDPVELKVDGVRSDTQEILALLRREGIASEALPASLDELNSRYAGGWSVYYEMGDRTEHRAVRPSNPNIRVQWDPLAGVIVRDDRVEVAIPDVFDYGEFSGIGRSSFGLPRITGSRYRFSLGAFEIEAVVIDAKPSTTAVVVGVVVH